MVTDVKVVTDDEYLRIALKSLLASKSRYFSLCILDVDRMKSIKNVYDYIRNLDESIDLVFIKRNGFFSKWFMTMPFISADNTVAEFRKVMRNPRSYSAGRNVWLTEISKFNSQPQLTPRQKTVFRHIKNAESVWLISKKLNINIKTIYSHISAICEIYGAKNMRELYFFAQMMFL